MMNFIKRLLNKEKNASESHAGCGSEVSIPVELIRRNPQQVRKYFDQEKIQSLSESIKAQGLLQPIVVHKVTSADNFYYEVIAGERRFRAAQLAGMTSIPAIIREVRGNLRALALLENIQRENLSIPELVNAIGELKNEFGSAEAVAKAMGYSKRKVERYSRIYVAIQSIPGLASVFEKQITIEYGTAEELARIAEELQLLIETNPDKCQTFCEEIEKAGVENAIANYWRKTPEVPENSVSHNADEATPEIQKNPSLVRGNASGMQTNSSSATEALSCSVKESKRGLTLRIECPPADQVSPDSKAEIRKTIREFMQKLNMLDFDI